MLKKSILKEFLRYFVVGGSAFLLDFFILYIFKNYVFEDLGYTGIYISTAFGFIGGLTYNYFLSLFYVFENAKKNNRGKNFCSFIIFAVIGVLGLLMTELGMYVGVELMNFDYLFVKFIVSGFVLIWNYGARKILIFK